MAFDDWLQRSKMLRKAVPVPEGCIPPYFVADPINVVLYKAMKAIGWPRMSAYGDFLAPDGNTIAIAWSRAVLAAVEADRKIDDKTDADAARPLGTLFIVWGEGNFHKDREKMIDAAMASGRWIVRDLPDPPENGRGIKRGTRSRRS